VAIVQFALREKTRLGALRIRGDILMLQSLLWADEVREAAFPALETSIRISAQEREMSAALVDSMAADFEPEQFTDDYQVQLRQLIDAKLEKGESLDTEETFGAAAAEAATGEVIDLMEALKRSLEKKRGAGTADGDGAKAGAAKPAAKAPARKTATKAAGAKAADDAPGGGAADGGSAGDGKAAAGKAAPKTATSKTAASKTAASKTTASRSAAARARKGA
jgi:DNA end-binding protein Ku